MISAGPKAGGHAEKIRQLAEYPSIAGQI